MSNKLFYKKKYDKLAVSHDYNITDTNTIIQTINGKDFYTYSVYSDTDIDMKYIDELFNQRGIWKKVIDTSATFIYLNLKRYSKDNKHLWEYPSDIKNVTINMGNQITNKAALYNLFKKYDSKICDKYMVKQYRFGLNNFEQSVDKTEFEIEKLWILKPVHTMQGIGIHIFDDYNEFINHMKKERNTFNKHNKSQIETPEWVLAKYITNPMLFRKKKFHFRVPFLYHNGSGYLGKKFSIITAKDNYVNSDYFNKKIHDSHRESSIPNLFFPDDLTDLVVIENIFNSMINLFSHIVQVIKLGDNIRCYNDTNKCFEVFGADVMVTENGEIKLLEINDHAGFTGFVEDIIEGVLETVIDNIYPTTYNIVGKNFFVQLMNGREFYKSEYIKYKKQYVVSKQSGGLNVSNGFPYYKNYYGLNRDKFMKLVKEFEPKILDYIPEKFYKKNEIMKYNGKYVLIEENWDKNEELNNVTDYFTEECRVICVFKNGMSPLDYWTKNGVKIMESSVKKFSKEDIKYIRDTLYENTKLCNNFRVSVAITVLRLFGARKWLDISAGWGDRLVAAIAHDVDLYCGVDPNDCLHDFYRQIITTLATPDKYKNYILIKSGFETALLPDVEFDLVFSSPPFFDLEIYSQSEGDSLVNYNTVEKWYNDFLIVSVKKAAEWLIKGGHMVLYMGEGIGTKYIQDMINDISTFMKYLGNIYYFYPGKGFGRTLYVWQKI